MVDRSERSRYGSCFLIVLILVMVNGADSFSQDLVNPITASFLQKHLARQSPKLILTPAIERDLKKKLPSDELLQTYVGHLESEADRIMEQPLLERELEGFRLLAVSREFLERMTTLCMVYRLRKDRNILERIDREVLAVCNFKDWNPQHFLDVAEMSLGMAVAVDWVGAWLPEETVKLAKTSLIEKGIMPSFNTDQPRMFWINSSNNWNAVCHGGMIAASIVVADIDPELSAKTISRALEKLPNSLHEYGPDGIYPEGPTYWGYGTSYSVIAANILETALGSDFGISESPGFMQSPNFVLQSISPNGGIFNFADCGDYTPGRFAVLLSWFAAQTGDGLYFDEEFFQHPQSTGRLAGFGLVWLSQYKEKQKSQLAETWYGKGPNPVAIFRDEENDFYLATKGGSASISHGNMDAGSFVFELNGVRWSIDPGNQPYYPLNRIGFNLAGLCQDCPRWTLLTKHNMGHSTVSVNDALFNADGYAPLAEFREGVQPEVIYDMSDILKGQVSSAQRSFVKESDHSILIEDILVPNDSTKSVTWGMMTLAEVQPQKNGARLVQDGKEMYLRILQPEGVQISIISLDPPPMEIDKVIESLKRIEVRIPTYTQKGDEIVIRIRLSAESTY